MTGRKILVFSRDPGGANAVAPLLEPLRARGHQLIVFGKDAALPIYRKFQIDSADITQVTSCDTRRAVESFAAGIQPDLILTGTSSEDFTERWLWVAAEKMGIRSFAVLDQWTNYRLRLIPDPGVPPMPDGSDSLLLPSFLFVMDELAKDEVAALGIDRSRLLSTGQPFFDEIRKSGERVSVEESQSLHSRLSSKNHGKLLVFASQPIAELHRQNEIAEDYWGYTEKSIFRRVFSALDQVTQKVNQAVTFVVRLHPKDGPDAYRDLLPGDSKLITPVFDRETDSTLLLKAADLTIGMFSMILLEAAILQCPFISVQIGLKREDPLILSRTGRVRSILTDEELVQALQAALIGTGQAGLKLEFQFGATNRIINYLEKYA